MTDAEEHKEMVKEIFDTLEEMKNPPDNPYLHKACKEYLESLGVVLWSDFIISNPDQKDKAIKWLMVQYEAVEKRLAQIVEEKEKYG